MDASSEGPVWERRPRWRRWARRALLAAIALALGVFFGLPPLVATVGHRMLMSRAAASLEGELRLERLRFRWPGELRLQQLELRDRAGRTVLAFEELSLNFGVIDALTGAVDVSVVLRKPRVHLLDDARGGWSIEHLGKTLADASRSSGGSDASGGSAAVSAPAATEPEPLPSMRVELEVRSAEVHTDTTLLLGPLEVRAALPSLDAPLQLRVEGEVELDASLRVFREGRLDLAAASLALRTLSARLDLSRWAPVARRFAPIDELDGTLLVNASATASAAGVDGEGTAELSGVRVASPRLGRTIALPQIDLRVAPRWREHGDGLTRIDVTLGDAAILSVEGSLGGVDRARVNLRADLAMVRDCLPELGDWAGTLRAALDATRDATGKLELGLHASLIDGRGPDGRAIPPLRLTADATREDRTTQLTALRFRGAGTELMLSAAIEATQLRAVRAELRTRLGELGRALGRPGLDGAMKLVLRLPTVGAREAIIERCRLTGPGLLLTADGRIERPLDASHSGRLRVKGRAEPARLTRAFGPLLPGALAGDPMTLDIALRLADRAVAANAAIGAPRLRWTPRGGEARELTELAFEVAGRADADGAFLERARIRLPGGRIDGTPRGDSRVALEGQLEIARLADWLGQPLLRGHRPAGRLTLRGSLDERGARRNLALRVEGADLEYRDPDGRVVRQRAMSCELDAETDAGAVVVHRLALSSAPLVLEAGGRVPFDDPSRASVAAAFDVALGPLSKALRPWVDEPLAGALSGEVQVGGGRLRLRARAPVFGVRGVTLAAARLDGSGRFDGVRLTLDRARMTADGAQVEASGALDYGKDHVHLALRGTADLARLGLPKRSEGQLRIDARGEGTLTWVRAFVWLDGRSLVIDGAPLKRGELALAAEGSLERIDVLADLGEGGRARAAVRIPPGEGEWFERAVGDVHVDLQAPLAPLVAAARVCGANLPDGAGDAALTVELRASRGALSTSGRLSARHLSLGDVREPAPAIWWRATARRDLTRARIDAGATARALGAVSQVRARHRGGPLVDVEWLSLTADYQPTALGHWLALARIPGVALDGEQRRRVSLSLAGPLVVSEDHWAAVVRRLDGVLTAEVGSLRVDGAVIVGRSRLQLSKGIIASEHRYDVDEAKARADIRVDLRDRPDAYSTLDAHVAKVAITPRLLPWLSLVNPLLHAERVQGSFGAKAALRYAGPMAPALEPRRLSGRARLEMHGIEALSSPILAKVRTLLSTMTLGTVTPKMDPLAVTIRDERIHYDEALKIGLGKASLYLDGSVGFDRSLDMELGLPLGPGMLPGIGKLPGMSKLPAQIRIPLRGTIAAPGLAVKEAFGALKRLLGGKKDK